MSKYFNETEFRCKCATCKRLIPAVIDPKLYELLDVVREAIGHSLIVASGVRCAAHNAAVHGKPDSDHLRGTAADIYITSDRDRFKFSKAAYAWGCRRLGKYKTFCHISVDTKNPQDVEWVD